MSTKSSTASVRRESKFLRYIKGPMRILARARDFYVNSLSSCAGHVSYAGAVSCNTLHPATLPRSFSANSAHEYSRDHDMRELIRIASARSRSGKLTEAELLPSRETPSPAAGRGKAAMKRSRTVAIGRIDEDRPCEFGVNEVAGRGLSKVV